MRKVVLKSIMLIGMICMLFFTFGIFAYADSESVSGDMDGNGTLTLRDALTVLKVAAQVDMLENDDKIVADVNGDTEINSTDAILILKKAIGMIHYFPGENIEASGTVYIAGDSIASEHDFDETYQRQVVGWGVVIGDLFNDSVTINNEARSGRSSKSYITSSDYNQYIGNLSKGDYFLISFGHNDEKRSDPSRYADPTQGSDVRESFKWYLKTYYIDPAVEVGAFPVLISPVVRCNYNGEMLNNQSHTSYALAMEELIEEYSLQGITVGYIDLHQMTYDYYNEIGQAEAESLHAYTEAGLDATHYCEKGARLVSEMIVDEMEKQGFDICKFLKTDQ